jgi:hypothetical protein
MNLKGQFNIVGVLGALITLLFLGATMPIIMSTTNTMGGDLTAGGFPTAAAAAFILPLVLILVAVMGIFRQGQGVQAV